MKRLALISLAVSCSLYAGGYKIPEVSTNGMALSAANIAHAHGADTAYYNPANMAFMPDAQNIEADLLYIKLDAVNYKGSTSWAAGNHNVSAEAENFIIPSFNYVSPKLGENNTRVGLSIVVPGGLSKRWNSSPAKDKAQEFTLEVVEINPTVAFSINDKLALAFGFRIVSTSGVVKSSAAVSRDMTGDTIDYGYNLALSYKASKNLELGLTYRSKVDLTVTGNAKLYNPAGLAYDGGANVTVPLPAFASIAAAYTFPTQTTLELVYERDMWSAYKTLDFNYAGNVGNLAPYFDDPIAKEWSDTNVYRLGITQKLSNVTLLAGAVYDETPIPDKTLSFELPDSNSVSVSLGARYHYSKTLDFGFGALYSMRDDRTINNSELNGTFSNSDVLMVSAGVGYKF